MLVCWYYTLGSSVGANVGDDGRRNKRGGGVRRALLAARGSGGRQNGASRPRVWLGFSVRCVAPRRAAPSIFLPCLSAPLLVLFSLFFSSSSLYLTSSHRSLPFSLLRRRLVYLFPFALVSFLLSFSLSLSHLIFRCRFRHRFRLDSESTTRGGKIVTSRRRCRLCPACERKRQTTRSLLCQWGTLFSISPRIYLPTYLPTYSPICLPTYLHTYLSNYQSTYLRLPPTYHSFKRSTVLSFFLLSLLEKKILYSWNLRCWISHVSWILCETLIISSSWPKPASDRMKWYHTTFCVNILCSNEWCFQGLAFIVIQLLYLLLEKYWKSCRTIHCHSRYARAMCHKDHGRMLAICVNRKVLILVSAWHTGSTYWSTRCDWIIHARVCVLYYMLK